MKIAIDVMGGDRGSKELVKGAVSAAEKHGYKIVLFGKKEEIEETLSELNSKADVEIRHTEVVIEMHDNARDVLKAKKESSMSLALAAAANGECDAVVSTGNSGALITGATLLVKRIGGVLRPAFAPVLPSKNGPVVLLDAGANVEVKPEYLAQFGEMGAVYSEKVLGKANARVGLVSNGKEEHKGTDLTREAKAMLEKADLNFVGYVEGNQIMLGDADVVVCDGFTGNVILKSLEGMSKLITGKIKNMLTANPVRIFGSLFILGGVKKFKKEFDSKQYGGAIILGVKVPVIKAHGNADAVAFSVAVNQAATAVEGKICEIFAEKFSKKEEE